MRPRESSYGQLVITGHARQLELFDAKPVVLTSKGLQGTGPAPEGRSWLRSFLVPEQCPPMVVPAIKHRRKSA
jgi:hypothetical protein